MGVGMRVPPGLTITTKPLGFPTQFSGISSQAVHTGQTTVVPGGDNGFDGTVQVSGSVGSPYTLSWSVTTPLTNGANPTIPFTAMLGPTFMGTSFPYGSPSSFTLSSSTDNWFMRATIASGVNFYAGTYSSTVTVTVTY